MKIGVKRLIALILVTAYVLFVGYGMFMGKTVPEAFVGVVGVVVGYYFGAGLNAKEETGTKKDGDGNVQV